MTIQLTLQPPLIFALGRPALQLNNMSENKRLRPSESRSASLLCDEVHLNTHLFPCFYKQSPRHLPCRHTINLTTCCSGKES